MSDFVPVEAAVTAPPVGAVRRALRADRSVQAGLAIVVALAVVAVAAPLVAPYDPLRLSANRLRPPNATNLLGTDALGRDVLSRLIFGARISLASALMASLGAVTIGAVVGAVAGYYGGFVDWILMRLVDLSLSVPGLILALAIAALFKPGLRAVLAGVVAVSWAGYGRIVRGLVLSARERDYVESARATGAGERRIILRHLLPNVTSPVAVLGTLEVGHMVLAVSGLSFLGLGAQPPAPEWGSMLNEGRSYLLSNPHLLVAPGLTIGLTVLGFSLIGDGIRNALDPTLSAPRSLT